MMNLWLLLPLLLPMLAGLLLLTKPFAEGKIRRLTVQIGLILTLVSLLPAFLTSGRRRGSTRLTTWHTRGMKSVSTACIC